MAGQLIVHFKKDDTREVSLAQVFGEDIPDTDRALVERIELYYDDLGRGSLSSYVVTRSNGNILIRPEAVFGYSTQWECVGFLAFVAWMYLVTAGFIFILNIYPGN